jgi:hypothetical protein
MNEGTRGGGWIEEEGVRRSRLNQGWLVACWLCGMVWSCALVLPL